MHNYYCYGMDILAPADGVVVLIKSNFPDCRIMDDDTRPLPENEEIKEGYIHRGLLVKNLKKEQ